MSREDDWSARSVRASRGDGVSPVLVRRSGADQCNELLQSWASWTDSLAMIQKRHPEVARIIVANLPHDTVPSLATVNRIDEELRVRMDLPTWEEFAEGMQPQVGEEGQEPTLPRHGWQKRAHKCLEDKFVSEEVWPSLSDADRAMAQSHQGPFAAAPFVALPTCRHSKFDPQVFRVLLRRRLRLPLPLSSRSCRCGRLLDPLGHQRAGCSEAGVLGKRGFPLEKAAEQVCREAGARVSTNVYVRDMDLAEHNVLDNRRLEVVADGLSLWNGSQLALDTTLVFPRWHSTQQGGHPQRSCPSVRPQEENHHIP